VLYSSDGSYTIMILYHANIKDININFDTIISKLR
jgi:hypothetical protein